MENGDSFVVFYNGKDDLPEEHQIFAYPEPEKSIHDTLQHYRQLIDAALVPMKARPAREAKERS